MAMSLLRLGRLGAVKCLLREGWSSPKSQLVAALCTKADVPPKTPKKAKASSKSKIIEADERASLLAYKPAVAFPSKLVVTGFLPQDVALGESETAEAVCTSAANETTTESPAANAPVEESKSTEVPPTDTAEAKESQALSPESKGQKDDDSTSSSSSSDSDSDSDSDDEEKPKTDTSESSEEKAEEKKGSGLTTEQVDLADRKAKPASFEGEHPETVTKAETEVGAASAKPAGSVETLVDPYSTTEAIPESLSVDSSDKIVDTAKEVKPAPLEDIVEIKAEEKKGSVLTTEQVESTSASFEGEHPETVTRAEPEVPAPSAKPVGSVETLVDPSSMTEEIPKSLSVDSSDKIVDTVKEIKPAPSEEIVEIKAEEAVKATPEEVANTVEPTPGDVAANSQDILSKAEAGPTSGPSEELVDPAPVEALAEADVVETPQEQAPEKAPEPEPEPFDNTTYKNLQHHNYNSYTFSDMDVEMAKHRLPQPSSGRPSPQH